ncbi:MAG: hypothetical protein J0651_00180, partial [Actinobacteria bacterium]|nr:hypothetical protein [Actinomycetota bacterium]
MTCQRLPFISDRGEDRLSRRHFLAMGAKFALIAGVCYLFPGASHCRAGSDDPPDARYWAGSVGEKADCLACHTPSDTPKDILAEKQYHQKQQIVKCLLCAHGCVLKNGERGRCRARINQNGVLKSLVYGRPAAIHVDPIEKKPFYHFLPGSNAFSLGTAGCPLSCRFCQNWEI